MVKPVPAGFHTVTPYLVVDGCRGLIDFLKKGFGAVQAELHLLPNGRVMHAQVKLGDSMLMLCDAPDGMPVIKSMLYVYVPNVDAVYKSALAAGAKPVREVADQFYGDRSGAVADPCGNTWWISTHVEDVSEAELTKRAAALKK